MRIILLLLLLASCSSSHIAETPLFDAENNWPETGLSPEEPMREGFPLIEPYVVELQEPAATKIVETTLQEALCSLQPGERLVVTGNHQPTFEYKGKRIFAVTTDAGCTPGTAEQPIQVVGEDATLRSTLLIGLPHWQFVNLEVTPEMREEMPGIYLQADNTLLNNVHVHSGRKDGIIVAGASDIVIANSHIHNFLFEEHGEVSDAHGIVLWPPSENVLIVNNHIHHNSGDAIQVWGPGYEAHEHGRVTNVQVLGNRLHDDRENALDVKDAKDVIIKNNKIWNYRASATSTGAGITIHYDADDIVVEENYISNAEFGVNVARGVVNGAPAVGKPNNVLIYNNYLESSLRERGAAVEIYAAECVNVYHNDIVGFGGGVLAQYFPEDTKDVHIANNLFRGQGLLGMWLMEGVTAEYNAFAEDIQVQLGGGSPLSEEHMHAFSSRKETFPHSVLGTNGQGKVLDTPCVGTLKQNDPPAIGQSI
ncbi:MAG: right-handed parallel beta-helix repeat-containing protein [Candidatus Woesearchaeota archaeon]|nr:right-handed parallel beta-helix repeat-containing protein [Candidatus Woesearchaeota archaeon]